MSCAGVNISRFVTLVTCGLVLASFFSARGADKPSLSSWPGEKLFTNGPIRQVRIDLGPEAVASLRDKARDYVAATVVENGVTYTNVGVHLKGSVGSFRALDDKPSLTLDFSKFAK